jgi:hypothetical protein
MKTIEERKINSNFLKYLMARNKTIKDYIKLFKVYDEIEKESK